MTTERELPDKLLELAEWHEEQAAPFFENDFHRQAAVTLHQMAQQKPVAWMFQVRDVGKGRWREFAAIDYSIPPDDTEELLGKQPLFAAPVADPAFVAEAMRLADAYAERSSEKQMKARAALQSYLEGKR
jgi:hypothetical protein